MKIKKLNSMIAIISAFTLLTFSFTLLSDDAYSLRAADRDYDGILDEDDQCPQISETFNKFEDEDGCPDTVIEEKTKYEFPDTDGDGFEDRVDDCPNLPETFNDYLDHDGCPERFAKTNGMEKDSDDDSVPDSIDACPDEKETINEFRDGDGCPDSLETSYSKTNGFEDGQCRGEKIAVMRVHTNDVVCVDLDTAQRWEGYGLGEILVKSEPGNGNLVVSGAEMMKDLAELEETKEGGIDFATEFTLKTLVEGGKHALTATPIIDNPRDYPEFFTPGEELSGDEMRVTFCGTSMPLPTISQSSPCVLVELGNGDKFVFDIGGGSLSRLGALEVPLDELNKIFVGHLHTDHVGDLDMLWAAGVPFGRVIPIELYGPNGADHSMGTQSFAENLLEAYKWDYENRRGVAPTAGAVINVHEFDWTKTHVVYDENDVQITAFPAIHGLDGAVSYRLDWNGLSFAFSSDTKPNKFYVENTQDVDISIHETFLSASQVVELWGMNPDVAKTVTEKIHTPPSWAGVVFELTEPRVAVGYHTYVTPETVPLHFEDIRTTYHGPYVLAQDLTTFNITPEGIVVRQAIVELDFMPRIPEGNADVPLEEKRYFISDWVEDSALDMDSLLEELKK